MLTKKNGYKNAKATHKYGGLDQLKREYKTARSIPEPDDYDYGFMEYCQKVIHDK